MTLCRGNIADAAVPMLVVAVSFKEVVARIL
jgi:hypothetical protein